MKNADAGAGKEAEWIQLLEDMEREMGEALNNLKRRKCGSLLDIFVESLGEHIRLVAEGYVRLRRASMTYASRMLVRPAMEAMFQIRAVDVKPELLYRIAFTEFQKERSWLRPLWEKRGLDYDTEADRAWAVFKEQYKAQFPKLPLEDKPVKLSELATEVGLEIYYRRYYSFYCKFIHVTMLAATGCLNQIESDDNANIVACLWCGLEAIVSRGGVVPNLPSLLERRAGLDRIIE